MGTHGQHRPRTALAGVLLVLLMAALALAACGTNNGSGNSSGGTAPTPAANATIAVLDGKSEGQTNDISSPFHLKAGDSIMVRYRLRRASGPVGLLVMIKLTTWSESPVEVDGVNEDKAGKGSVTWSAPEDGDYCVGVGVINAKYHVTVVKL